jgi:hypothetical protein
LAELPFLTMWPGLPVTWSVRQWPAKCPRGACQSSTKESRDQCGAGWENAISSYTLQLMVISRNLFHKLGVENLLQPYSMSKSAYLFSASCESEYHAYIDVAFIYKQGGEAIRSQSVSLHSTGNISAEDSEHQEQSRPQQLTWNSK